MSVPSRHLAVAMTAAASLVLTGPALTGDAAASPTPAAAVTQTSPVRIAASPSAVNDSRNRQFAPDTQYAVGGALVTSSAPVAKTASPVLYQRAREAGLGYNVPVSEPGTYFVDLFVAETQGSQPGQREWSVTAEGDNVVDSVDVARDAGANTAWHVLFAAPVTDGTLNLSFAPVTGPPLVGAVEVDYQDASTEPTTAFSDDFAGQVFSPPDTSHWSGAVGGNGWGNNEMQTYTRRTSNVSLDGAGNLTITARRETFTGSDGITRPYTSARLQTKGKFEFQYGTAEARMRVPAGQGLLSAFWALGSNIDTVGWPNCGEMDLMENLGSELYTVHGTLHAAQSGGDSWLTADAGGTSQRVADAFHTYGLVWGPNALAMTLDGRSYMTSSVSDLPAIDTWNFNHSFYLLLNLAVGGNWPGPPSAATPFPARMSVDYVRVVT